ncbi:hypothetical protein, partial [Leuconostoc mesenteroides]|uniref:hypothetical protein n=1 Tax=Leuconostoc mesenteroides TaxID=1245 RepID=UPI00235E0C97
QANQEMVPQITIFDSAPWHCFFVLSLSIDNTMNNIPCFVLHKVVYLRGLEEVLTCDFSSLLSPKITIKLQEIIISHFIYFTVVAWLSRTFF